MMFRQPCKLMIRSLKVVMGPINVGPITTGQGQAATLVVAVVDHPPCACGAGLSFRVFDLVVDDPLQRGTTSKGV